MRSAVLALLAVTATACATTPDVEHTGPPRQTTTSYDVPAVLHDFTPAPTTTTTQPVVPMTASPPVPVTVDEVVPLEAAPPTPARVGECGGWGDIVAQHFGAEAAKACDVIRCETGGTFDPTIENPRSTASGLAQFLDSTWVKARAMVGAEQYARAKDAPGAVQIAAMAAWKNATSWSQWVCA